MTPSAVPCGWCRSPTPCCPPQPSSPNVLRILLIGLAAGLALAYRVVMLRLRLDTKIRRPEDITAITDIGLIGTIPTSRDLRSRLHSEDLLRGRRR